MKNTFLALLSFFSLTVPAAALDPKAFAEHLRKTLSLDTRTDIRISTPAVPAGFGDLRMVTATLGGAPYPVFLTKDEKKYIWGFAVDATVDPDKARQEKISLKNVHGQGSPSAPVTIVEYSDLQCNHCKIAHEMIQKELYKSYTKDQVRFVFKHFPLSGHDWAEEAAAECAGAQKEENFWKVLDHFFANQEKITNANVKEHIGLAIKDLNLKKSDFNACGKNGAMIEKVRNDKKEGASVGVSSTPSLFINGRLRRGFRDMDDIKVVVDEKLKESKK
jgi:protein-disulfide isomerase